MNSLDDRLKAQALGRWAAVTRNKAPGVVLMIEWRQVHWPRPVTASLLVGLLTRLASDVVRGPLVWEARAEAGVIRYLLGAERSDRIELASLVPQLVPGACLTRLEGSRREAERCGRVWIRQRNLALALDGSEQLLTALIAALASARLAGDVLVVQVVLGRALPPEAVTVGMEDPTVSLWSKVLYGSRPASAEVRSRLRGKLDQFRFRALVRVGASARTVMQRRVLVFRVLAALRQLQSGGTRVRLVPDRPDAVDEARIPMWLPLRLTPAEALAFLAWPQGEAALPGLPAVYPRRIAPPPDYQPPSERVFAHSNAPGESRGIGIGIEDACRHTHILGPTGTGKSNLLLHLIKADIAAGRSVVLIDPKRDLAMDTLAIIPAHRQREVVVIDPQMTSPVGINPLTADPKQQSRVADSVLATFHGLFPSLFGPRTSDILHASLLTLMRAPEPTLLQLPRLLTDARFRRSLTASITDRVGLGSFWAWWEALSSAQQAQAIGPVMSRLRQFLLRPGLVGVLDQPRPRFHLAELFAAPKILIVSLNRGLLGSQSAALLGSLIVSQLWHLALQQAAIPPAQRRIVSLFLDEAQCFLHLDADLGEALEQSRSLRVAWHLAHQFRHQMPPTLMAGIDANTRNKIVFALDTSDAAATARGTVLTPADLSGLAQYEIYASLLSHGHQTGWFSGRTLPPPQQCSSPEAILAESQARYGRLPETPATITSPMSPTDPENEPLGRTIRTGA